MKASDAAAVAFICCLLCFSMIGVVLCACQDVSTERRMQREAVKHNAAKFVIVNPETGRTEFKWNDE